MVISGLGQPTADEILQQLRSTAEELNDLRELIDETIDQAVIDVLKDDERFLLTRLDRLQADFTALTGRDPTVPLTTTAKSRIGLGLVAALVIGGLLLLR